jgi:Protein of unknown function (DUF2510)
VAEAGWKPDPNGRHEWRYFDGVAWTDKVSDDGVTASDPYDPEVVPPPPPGPPTAVKESTGTRQIAYRLHLIDRRGQEIYAAPYQSPDMAIHFAEQNPTLHMKHTVGSVLLKGFLAQNIVRWRQAIIMAIDEDTGEATEYHRMRQ